LAIALYHYEKPVYIAERAMKLLEEYDQKLKELKAIGEIKSNE
jgi:hypothetical protein